MLFKVRFTFVDFILTRSNTSSTILMILEFCNSIRSLISLVSGKAFKLSVSAFISVMGVFISCEILVKNCDCTVTNIYGDQEALQDISLLYLYGGEGTSKFVNCTFHNNVTTYNSAPSGMYCSTQVEFSNCLSDAIFASQAYQGDFFGIGNNVQITLNNNFITGQEPEDTSRPGFEESICDNPSITCNNNRFFIDTEYLGWFPGPNFYDFEDAVGDDSDGNSFNYNIRLKEGSPAIDAGNDAYNQPPVTVITDLGGESRFSGAHIDVGAYEYQQVTISDDDVEIDKDFGIYPVPFSNEINISTTFTEKITYSLFDAVGNLIKKEELQEATRKINTRSLSSGVYILKLQLGHNIISHKIVKQ